MDGILLVLLIVGGLVLLGAIAWGVFWLLVQAGVVVSEARKPPTTDTNDYSLSQSREVKSEEQ